MYVCVWSILLLIETHVGASEKKNLPERSRKYDFLAVPDGFIRTRQRAKNTFF